MKIQNVKLKMVRENIGEYKVRDFKATSPITVVNVINTVFDIADDTQENLGILLLDTKNKIIGAELIGRGTVNACMASPRDILQRALMIGAVNIILFHNHPSGETEPSRDDISLTKRIKEACNIMDIGLLDHIIIGADTYTSFKEDSISGL